MPQIRHLLAAILLLLLAACDEGPATNTRYVHSGGSEQYLVEATKTGAALPLVVRGEVFGDPARIYGDYVLSTMMDGLKARAIRFTPATDAISGFRVVVVFGAIESLDASKLCASSVPQVTAAAADRVEVLAAFCQGTGLLSAVDGWAAESTTLDEERPRMLLRQVAQGLFVAAQDHR